MKKKIVVSIIAGLIAASMSMTAYAATAQDIIAKNQGSYTAGTQSVYGPKLTQDQLNAVAQATANFKTTYITDNMDNDAKIQTAHDFLKNNVSYIDWNKGEGANTAYGALVKGQAACSGYARAFKALCDSMDVSCYYIHADATAGNPSHQWNMVEYNDGYYFIDVEANDSSGFNAIYHSSTHPYTCDMSQLPAIGSKSGADTAGTQTVNNGWQEENGKWFYYENGSKAENKWINGTYYVGGDGAMLVNTTTPDGYQVGSDGAWIKSVSQNGSDYTGTGIRSWQSGAASGIWTNEEGKPLYYAETKYAGTTLETSCNVIDSTVTSFQFKQNLGNINPEGHSVEIVAAKPNGFGSWWYIGEGKKYPFEYGRNYSFNCTDMSDSDFINFCQTNDVIVVVYVYDDTVMDAVEKDYPGWAYSFATSKSIKTGQIG